jgi:transcriptional regulator NrdR family protein
MIRPKPLICRACGSARSRVIDAREGPPNRKEQLAWPGGYWRQRRCLECRRTFTTAEKVVEDPDSSDISADPPSNGLILS